MSTQQTGQRLFTAREASQKTGFSYWYIRVLARTGEVPVAATYARRAPLFDAAGIAWLTARRAKSLRGTEPKP